MSYAITNTTSMSRLKREGPTKRVSLDLPEALYERLRLIAFKSRDSMNLIGAEMVTRCAPAFEAEIAEHKKIQYTQEDGSAPSQEQSAPSSPELPGGASLTEKEGGKG